MGAEMSKVCIQLLQECNSSEKADKVLGLAAGHGLSLPPKELGPKPGEDIQSAD